MKSASKRITRTSIYWEFKQATWLRFTTLWNNRGARNNRVSRLRYIKAWRGPLRGNTAHQPPPPTLRRLEFTSITQKTLCEKDLEKTKPTHPLLRIRIRSLFQGRWETYHASYPHLPFPARIHLVPNLRFPVHYTDVGILVYRIYSNRRQTAMTGRYAWFQDDFMEELQSLHLNYKNNKPT
jgi:hypothetical protein